jgi:1,4-alpha-glucan branching enzyme
MASRKQVNRPRPSTTSSAPHRIPVSFMYCTGIREPLFSGARLHGSWDAAGRLSAQWSIVPMTETVAEDGCPAFTATIELDSSQIRTRFEWGVTLDGPAGPQRWAIMTEENRHDSRRCVRAFVLAPPGEDAAVQTERYWLSLARRVGAQKLHAPGTDREPALQFRVWAPNAQAVEVCIGPLLSSSASAQRSLIDPVRIGGDAPLVESAPRASICGGFIADDGSGAQKLGPFSMVEEEGGFWSTRADEPELARFRTLDHVPYMYRVTKDSGRVAYRTDLYSRCQVGSGSERPTGSYTGPTSQLDGSLSCSAVVDPDRVTEQFLEPVFPERHWVSQEEFFADARAPRALPSPSDLVIYELHLGALGADVRAKDVSGTLEDALRFLDYLQDLGVNAVELLPLSEFGGSSAGWGYATSHYFAIEYSGGGRDQYKWFVRECHRHGIAVLMDVVYNHYSHSAERGPWMYDTDDPARNPYYWYEGKPEDHAEFDRSVEPERREQGGYLDNLSTGWAPRYWEEPVRRMFVSSALSLATEFEVDGFRVDQTTSIHSYNRLHADGRPVDSANAFGAKLLRELTRSLRFVRPGVALTAEDHSNWSGVVEDPDQGGLGFHATWYSDFYHHLIGDTTKGSDYAKLIKTAGLGDDRALAMGLFAGALQATAGGQRVVYHESHDEAGNGELTDRTIRVAVNGAPLFGETRRFAEARCRFAAGVTLLCAGIPMFLFGEEVGAQNKFLYGHVLEGRENLYALRDGPGRRLYDYYRELIALRRRQTGLRSPNIDVFYVHDEHRLIAFRRWDSAEDFLVIASLRNQPFASPGYLFHSDRIAAGRWREIFNSDAAQFGGDSIGNLGATLDARTGAFECVVPANGVLVFQRVG